MSTDRIDIFEDYQGPDNPAAPKRCPTCDSHDPKLHPAVQAGGEVQLCRDTWHKPTADEIRAGERSAPQTMSGAMRVWWIPQVPGRPFMVPVESIKEAKKLLDVLARYDDFQFRNRIKPDYCNVGGLSVFVDGEWTDWFDEDGNSIDELSE